MISGFGNDIDDSVIHDTAVDGNAMGGLLNEIFGAEMTTAVGVCAFCGTARQLAEAIVYFRAPGAIMRCRTCTAVLLLVTRRGEMNCVDLSGLAALDVPS
jgi:hypothetical protein